MRKILISAALISAAAVAAPASAQYYQNDYNRGYGQGYGYNQNYGRNIDQQINQIQQRIERAARNGRISRSEANRLFRQAEQIDRLYDRYRRNGLSQYEARDLQNRIQYLRQNLRFERQEDRYDRDGRYDRDDRYYRDDD